jgi:S-adenosylmethionine decarboxylase
MEDWMADVERHRAADRVHNSCSCVGGVAGPNSNSLRPDARCIDAATAHDHFVEREGLRFAGTHLILDLWNACKLDDLALVERTLRKAAEAAGATLLRVDLHCFQPTGGITGVAILAESHISIHTWPERSYAAIDIFMCGDAKPHKAIDVIREAFAPETATLFEHKRGLTA